MSNILVITTPTHVYTTFYKTIHGKCAYKNQEEKDSVTTNSMALAFGLACTDHKPNCENIELQEAVSDKDIFNYLERRK